MLVLNFNQSHIAYGKSLAKRLDWTRVKIQGIFKAVCLKQMFIGEVTS